MGWNMGEIPLLPIIATILSFIAVLWMYKHIEEIEPLLTYSSSELMARALYCHNEFCPKHGYQYGTFGTINGEEVCYCGNESRDFYGWVVEKVFYLNGTEVKE
ncbi:hypothetical protein DRN69_03930 [Candidatus Pacearchaeota archaeon]|nr:MAG: hypothetical protein DRN69_03930 [Candidatus Pacearchaeota archaeon]